MKKLTKNNIRKNLKAHGFKLIEPSYYNGKAQIIFNAYNEYGEPYNFSIDTVTGTGIRLILLPIHGKKDLVSQIDWFKIEYYKYE